MIRSIIAAFIALALSVGTAHAQLGRTAPGCPPSSLSGCTYAGPLGVNSKFSLTYAPGTGSVTGSLLSDLNVGNYPSSNDRARYWNDVLTVTGTQAATSERNFFNMNLTVPGATTNPQITATVSGGAVQSPLTIATAGSGLPNGTYTLYFQGGGGTGAAGTATVSGGIVNSTSLTAGGSGYTTAPGVAMEIGITTGETNIVHPYGQVDPGVYFSSAEFEPFEASFLNNGIMGAPYQGLNALYNNGSLGLTTSAMGVHLGVINGNSVVGSLAEYDGIYLQPWSGGGTIPSSYYAMKINDSAASISTLGGMNIGSIAANTAGGTLSVFGPDTSGGTCPLQLRNSSGLMLTVCDNGTMTFSSGFMTLGSGGNWGKLLFGNTTSGTLQLNAPASGALSGTVTLPNGTTTLAGLAMAQTFTAAQTFGSGSSITFSVLPSGTAATYACFTSGGQLISSATAC